MGWRGGELVRRVREAAQEAVEEAAETVFTASQGLVPVLTSQLQESGDIEPLDGQIGVKITYGDDEPRFGNEQPSSKYAIRQHEDLSLNHPGGGQAKYLEQPTRELAPAEMERALKKHLRDALQ